jgi:hypothetical protein
MERERNEREKDMAPDKRVSEEKIWLETLTNAKKIQRPKFYAVAQQQIQWRYAVGSLVLFIVE